MPVGSCAALSPSFAHVVPCSSPSSGNPGEGFCLRRTCELNSLRLILCFHASWDKSRNPPH